MKAFLLYRDRDFDMMREPVPREKDLVRDLELETLFNGMAAGDAFLLDVAKRIVPASVTDVPTVLYRQGILRDCIKNAKIVRNLYDLAVEAIERERKNYWGVISNHPGALLHRSVDVLHMFAEMLQRLRREADGHTGKFDSEGFKRLFLTLQKELSDEYLELVRGHLSQLKFRRGVLISARLGKGNKGVEYVLRKPNADRRGWIEQILTKGPPSYTFRIHERDEPGARALSDLNSRGIGLVARALAQSNDHILSFFKMLRTELAFYVGCLNLHDRLSTKSEPVCFPEPGVATDRWHRLHGLYDVCLALRMDRRVVGNDLDGDEKDLVVITGANQGGKSTFLRSIGLAQLMMQCGMFVPAELFRVNLCAGLFTHFKREEEAEMRSGKFDEELRRMSDIANHLAPECLLLLNEPFQSTNEREGSEVGRQIVQALLELHIKVFIVTHMYDLSHSLYNKGSPTAMFLRAERREDGTRTFRVAAGEPLSTAYGKDVYDHIFGAKDAEPSRLPSRAGQSDVNASAPQR
jgi:DNA mismatch repair ATPase MutS